MKFEDKLKRLDEIIQLANRALGSVWQSDSGQRFVRDEPMAEYRAAGLSFLKSLFSKDHPYYTDFDEQTKAGWPSKLEASRGLLTALEGDLAGGWLASARGLISAEIFSDFVDMAVHLLDEGYKDAAAVIAGGVLEQRLRDLCSRAQIDLTAIRNGATVARKADSLNADLAKAGIYSGFVQKSVTAWLDLRNKAAHGRYSEYSQEQVANLIDGLRHFLLTTSEQV